jgi:cytochrome c-type biogenesis protein CcmF
MTVAHLGVAIFIIGVTLVKGYETERDLRMAPGDKVTHRRLRVHLQGARGSAGPELRGDARRVRGAPRGLAALMRTMHPRSASTTPAARR